MRSCKEKWDEKHAKTCSERTVPCEVLQQNHYLLPCKKGKALDVACGLGGNAIYLAEKGFSTLAWDISIVAVKKLSQYATKNKLPITVQQIDLDQTESIQDNFDVIVVSHFLHRPLLPLLLNALNPGGLLFYQTYTTARIADHPHVPQNKAWLLKPEELLHLCRELLIRVYRDEGTIGDTRHGFRNRVYLIGEKRTPPL